MAYGVQAEGNARPESDPHGELDGQNTLFRALQNDKLAAAFDLTEKEIATSLAASSKTLLAHRATRPKPHRDDKIITAWNGLVIAALSKAATVFSSEKYAVAASTAAHFIKDNLWKNDLLFRSYRGKASDAPAFPADYTFLIFGLIDLHAIDPSAGWLDWATDLQSTLDQEYWNEEKLGYVVTTKMNGQDLLTIREDYDGAEPSPNHIAALNLLKLSVLETSDAYAKRAEALLRAGANTLEKQPFAAPVLIAAHDLNNRGVIHFQIPEEHYAKDLNRLTQTHRPRAIFDSHDGTDILLCEGQTCRIFSE